MARHLHTAVADEIRDNAFDAGNAAELRMESSEYAEEVRGHFDYDDDEPDRDYDDDEPDSDNDI